MQSFWLVEIKRSWVPAWLYWLLYRTVEPLVFRQPLRIILHRKPQGRIVSTRCPHCSRWFDPVGSQILTQSRD